MCDFSLCSLTHPLETQMRIKDKRAVSVTDGRVGVGKISGDFQVNDRQRRDAGCVWEGLGPRLRTASRHQSVLCVVNGFG